MEAELEKKLADMIRSSRVVGLGTIRDGAPLVSLVAYLPEDDFSAFYIHVSQLAQHTQGMMADARVGLLISEKDNSGADPQTLMRVSIMGAAEQIPADSSAYPPIRSRYIARFSHSARFVAGFAQAFNLTLDAMKRVSKS